MRYGKFDDKRREYVITRPDTPLPWINYLGCEAYFGIISNTAGGYSFYKDARLRRITRYRYNNAPFDMGGRYIYLRDSASGEFWSPSWMPTRHKAQGYSCRHGMGYTTIGSTYGGIEARTRYFVPMGENLEIWQLTVTNRRKKPAKLSVFSSIEFCLWDAWDDQTNFQRNFSTGQVEVDDGVIYHKTEYRERRDHFAYFACSEKLAGFDTQRDTFLGAYRGWDDPAVVESGRSANSVAHGWAPIGSHHVKISLRPGESKQIVFLLGYQEMPKDQKFEPADSQTVNKQNAKPLITKYRDLQNVEAAFRALKQYWEETLSVIQVDTPDLHTNRMVNIWNAYQCMATFNMSRSASFYESGVGRGLGFRDSNQDLLGFVQMVPARARERILDLAATQLKSGGAFHQYQPLTKRGNNDVGSGFNDDPLWLILGVTTYIKETGDTSILDEKVPYENEPGSEKPLYDHLQRSARYTLDRLGPHKLPLIGRADWNDCLNLNCFSDTPGQSFQTTTNKDGKTAESVFIGGLFVLAANELADLAETLDLRGDAKRYRWEAERMKETVQQHGWDGEWFVRAYDDFGRKVGSKECKEGQIFIESQGMCVMAGIGLEGRHGAENAGVGQRPARDQARDRPQPAGLHPLLHRVRRNFVLPAGVQGKRGDLLPQQSVDHDRRDDARERRPGPRLLHPDQPFRARGDRRDPPLRAVCLPADDRRARCPDARRGKKLLADRNRGLEFLRHHPIHPGDPPDAEGAANHARDPVALVRILGDPQIPGSHLPDIGQTQRKGQLRLAHGGRPSGAGGRHPAAGAGNG